MHSPIVELRNITFQDRVQLVLGQAELIRDSLRSYLKLGAQALVLVKTRQQALERAAPAHGVSSTRPMPVFQLRTGS